MAIMELDMFAWEKDSNTLVAEMSTIDGNKGFTGSSVFVQGKHLVHPVEFCQPRAHVNNENEVEYWDLQPLDAGVALTGLTMRIFND